MDGSIRVLARATLLCLAVLAFLGLAPRSSAQTATAQSTARIVGRIVDARTGEGVSAAEVRVAGTALIAYTGVDGRYVIAGVPRGVVALEVRSLGYAPLRVTGIAVPAGGVVEQDAALGADALEIERLEVTAGDARGTVARALELQRNAASIVSAVTAEQISRSPDGDAAAAVRRVSGVTVQDGKYVFVRGLGERYTTASLNGARIPSPEPERKVVPLDLFPSGLLETITMSKTFTPDQPGDFSGAQVDIRTREFPAERVISHSLSIGYNAAATGRTVLAAPAYGLEWLGFGAAERALPAVVARAGNFDPPPSRDEISRIVGAFRDVWSAERRNGAPNLSLSASLGGTDPIFGRPIGYLASATYSYGQEVRTGEVRAQAQAEAGGATREVDRFRGSTGRTSVLWGGVLNLSTLLGSHSRIALNSTYSRSAENEARRELGTSENHGGLPLDITRLRYVERSVYSTQLLGQHEPFSGHRIEWSLTRSGVRRLEPDRSEFVYAIQPDPATGAPLPPTWFSASTEGAVRTFGDLAEDALEATLSYGIGFGGAARPHRLEIGWLTRSTDREAQNRAYALTAPGGRLSREILALPPEQIFGGAYDSLISVVPLSQGGSFTARDRLLAGYAMLELAHWDRLRLIGGARIERSDVAVASEPTIGAPQRAEARYTDVLPAASLVLRLGEQQNLRLSASRTLSRPEYRELAGVQYREVLGGDNVAGNPDLVRTRILNLDLRWELYPNPGEVLSVALFAKRFTAPIERVYLGTSGTRIVTFLNAESARNDGVEVEARKNLSVLGAAFEPLWLFANATLVRSEIRIGDGNASKINDERAMVGQAPYVVNAGLTYAAPDGGLSATLLYNVVGERIVSAAEAPLPDVYEQPRHALDLSLRFPLFASVSAKLDVKNLLDSPHEVTQGTVVRERYRTGRVFSAGVTWRP